MNATDAAAFANMIGCKTVVGVHFNTFGYIKINPDEAKKIFADAGVDLKSVAVGGSVEV